MSNMQKFIDIVSGSPSLILEAPFWNTAKNSGERKRKDLINKMNDSWQEWLGMTGHQGTAQDMINFLISRVGFSQQDTKRILDIAGTPIVNSNQEDTGSEEDAKEEPKYTGSSETESPKNSDGKERIEPKLHPEKEQETSVTDDDYDGIMNALKFSVVNNDGSTDQKNQVIHYADIISNPNVYDKFDKQEKNEVVDSLAAAMKYMQNADSTYDTTKWRAASSDIIASLKAKNPQPETSPKTESILREAGMLDSVLSKKEIADIFNDAATYAFSNNIVGNKNYAREYSGYEGSDPSNNSGSSNGSNNKLSVPNQKRAFRADAYSEVLSGAIGAGRLDNEGAEEAMSLRKKSFDELTDADKKLFAPIGWSFMKSLG